MKRTFQNLGIEWRAGKELWRGYTFEVRSIDRDRAIEALIADETAGNISALDGVNSPDSEPAPELIGRPVAELLKSERFAESTLEGRVLRYPEVKSSFRAFPNVVSFAAKRRWYLGDDNRRHAALEGWVELSVDLEEKIAGRRITYHLRHDGWEFESHVGNEWWHGTPEEIERNRKRYGFGPW